MARAPRLHASRLLAVLASAALLVVGVAACSGDDGAPVDGTTEGTRPGSGTGNGTGTGTGDGTGKGDTGTSTTPTIPATDGGSSDAGGATGKKELGIDCTTNDECASGVCFVGEKASYCSLRCNAGNAVQVCVAPFTGQCNNQGYCRRP